MKPTVLWALALALPAVALAEPQPAPQPEQPQAKESLQLPSLSPLVDSVKAAVVNVEVTARARRQVELFDFFGGDEGERRPPRRMQGAGSGFIIDPKGLALTNNHVVEGAISIRVKLDDGRSFNAEVLGRDPLTDVALVKLKNVKSDLPFVKLGDSDAVKVGDWVVAIGNPFGLASSVSLGIISARARQIRAGPYDDFLQTDAAINPGNSGGPLFNAKGEVVGINTAIVASGSGIGFAVPSNLAKALLPQLQTAGSVTRAWLGIGIQDLTPELARALGVPESQGAIVSGVNEGSPAAKGGLRQDDVVTAIDGQKIASGGELSRTTALKKPGSVASLTVYRGGSPQPLEVKVTLGTRPDLEGVSRRGQPEEDDDGMKGARVGLAITDMDPRLAQMRGWPATGALIADVVPGSAADRAELQPGMLVVEANKKAVKTRMDLWHALQGAKSGQILLLRVRDPQGGTALRALTIP